MQTTDAWKSRKCTETKRRPEAGFMTGFLLLERKLTERDHNLALLWHPCWYDMTDVNMSVSRCHATRESYLRYVMNRWNVTRRPGPIDKYNEWIAHCTAGHSGQKFLVTRRFIQVWKQTADGLIYRIWRQLFNMPLFRYFILEFNLLQTFRFVGYFPMMYHTLSLRNVEWDKKYYKWRKGSSRNRPRPLSG